MAKESISSLITAGRILERLKTLFAEIERQYFLEVARFTTIMFYNDANFEKIKEIIKNGKVYHRFVTSDIIYQIPDCKITRKYGKEQICTLPMEQLQAELDNDIRALGSLVSIEDIEKASDVSKIMTTGSDEIVQRALSDYSVTLDSIPNIAKVQAADVIKLAIRGVSIGVNAGLSAKTTLGKLSSINQQQREKIELAQIQDNMAHRINRINRDQTKIQTVLRQKGKGRKTYKRRNRRK
jgi:hypothetical protein